MTSSGGGGIKLLRFESVVQKICMVAEPFKFELSPAKKENGEFC
jgi:hypothetical protein